MTFEEYWKFIFLTKLLVNSEDTDYFLKTQIIFGKLCGRYFLTRVPANCLPYNHITLEETESWREWDLTG
jgi:hypothetical protein